MASREAELATVGHVRAELIRLLELVEEAEKNGTHPGLMPSEPVGLHVRLAGEHLHALVGLLSKGLWPSRSKHQGTTSW